MSHHRAVGIPDPVACPIMPSPALTTNPGSKCRDECIDWRVFVARWAVRLARVNSGAILPVGVTHHGVLAARDRLQMGRIDARPVLAFVVQMEAGRNVADHHRVGESVRLPTLTGE